MSNRLRETREIVMVLEPVLGAKVQVGHAGHRKAPSRCVYVGQLPVLNLDGPPLHSYFTMELWRISECSKFFKNVLVSQHVRKLLHDLE